MIEAGHRIPRRRWRIGLLLGVGVLVNYFDRIGLSVAGPQIARELSLTPQSLGVLLSSFFWCYALLQVPAGMLLDRFGVQRVARTSVLLWALASLMTALSAGFGGLLAARLLLGAAEAPSFPANAKAVGHWFPRQERGLSTALFDAAAKFSNVVGVPLIAFAVVVWGWRMGFGVIAALNLAYAYAFWRVYREPTRDPSLSRAERDYLLANGGGRDEGLRLPAAALLRHLLRQRKMWGVAIGFGAYGYCFYFFLTWLPTYYMHSLGRGMLASAGYAAIPWACATISDLAVGGWMIDHLIARGHNATRVRKAVLVVGMSLGLAVFGAAGAQTAQQATIWISIALSGLAAAAPVAWSLPGLIAPRGGAGETGALMNFSNNAFGAAAPLVTGYLLGSGGSYAAAFGVAGGLLLIGIAAFGWLMGRIEPMPSPPG